MQLLHTFCTYGINPLLRYLVSNQLSNTVNNKFVAKPSTTRLMINLFNTSCCYNMLIPISNTQHASSTNRIMNGDVIAPDTNLR